MTPEAALRYVRLLSTDIRAAAVLDEAGTTLAGDPGLVEALGSDGRRADLLAATGGGWTVVVRTGPHALDGLLEGDLRRVLPCTSG